jgi:ribosomal protein S1
MYLMICSNCATPLLEEAWICQTCGEIRKVDSSSDQLPPVESKWHSIRRQCGSQCKARVYRSNNGGLLVNLYTVRGFVPLAQLLCFSDKERITDNAVQEATLQVMPGQELNLSLYLSHNKSSQNDYKYSQVLIFTEHLASPRSQILASTTQTDGGPLHAYVVGSNKYGLIVEIHNIKGFVPASQLLQFTDETGFAQREDFLTRLRSMKDKELHLSIMGYDHDHQNLILSERVSFNKNLWDIMENHYYNGDLLIGWVTGYHKSGLLVNVSGIEGFVPAGQLLQITEDEAVAGGDILMEKLEAMQDQELSLKAIGRDLEHFTLILSERAASLTEPLMIYGRSYSGGDALKAKIVRVTNVGLIVDVTGMRGFVPRSQTMDFERKISDQLAKSIDDLPYEQEIFLKVIGSDRGFHEFILSEKAIYNKLYINKNKYKHRNFDASTFRVGDMFPGIIVNITGFGVFVDHDGYVGLLHSSQFGENTNKHPSEVFSLGQEVDVFIQGIDVERQRIILGLGK